MLDEFAEPITTIASHRGAIAISADWRFVVAKHRSLRPGTQRLGHRLACRLERAGPVAVRQRRLREDRDGLGKLGKGEDVFGRLDAVHGVGSDSHRADGFLVALVADVDDAIALAGAHLHLVVHFGDERADRVDDVAARLACRGDDLGGGAVRGQHEGRAGGHLAHIVDEDHAESA